MGVGAGLYMCDLVKKFTFAISSPDEFLFLIIPLSPTQRLSNATDYRCKTYFSIFLHYILFKSKNSNLTKVIKFKFNSNRQPLLRSDIRHNSLKSRSRHLFKSCYY